jgi:hypothetical protein
MKKKNGEKKKKKKKKAIANALRHASPDSRARSARAGRYLSRAAGPRIDRNAGSLRTAPTGEELGGGGGGFGF